MIRHAQQAIERPLEPAEPIGRDEQIAPAPRVSIQAFCETVETAAAIQGAGEDRRLAKTHLKIQMGGVAAAVAAYRGAPTPNVIVLEVGRPQRSHPVRSRFARGVLRCRYPGHRHRAAQRRHAVPRTAPPWRQRLPDLPGQHDRRGSLDLRAVLVARFQAGRPHRRGGRRQGRRRGIDHRAQRGMGHGARACARVRW